MSKQKTYAAIVLDKSGSMHTSRKQTVEGFNEHVQQLKEDSADQDIFVSLITFNGQVFEHLWNEPAEKITEAVMADYRPSGCTALYDAVGYTIDKLSETVQVDENTSFLIVIISDGMENASDHFTSSLLQEKIQEKQSKGNWTFTYMGCDESYLKKLSKETAIPISNMAAWSNKTAASTSCALHESRDKMKKYFAARSVGASGMSACYHSESVDYCANYEDIDKNTNVVTPVVQNSVQPQKDQNVCVSKDESITGYFNSSDPVKWKN
jgi:hypothetical protein